MRSEREIKRALKVIRRSCDSTHLSGNELPREVMGAMGFVKGALGWVLNGNDPQSDQFEKFWRGLADIERKEDERGSRN